MESISSCASQGYHSVVQDTLKEIGNGGQADVIFATFKSGG